MAVVAQSRGSGELPPMDGVLPHLEWSNTAIPVRKWIVDGIIPARTVTLLQGDGGLGKSLLTLQLAHACATGRRWLGQTTRPCKVFALYCEDEPEELQRRLHDINEYWRQAEIDLPEENQLPGWCFEDLENLVLASRVGMENLLVSFEHSDATAGQITTLLNQIDAESEGCELVILDSLHDLYGGNENNRVQVRQFINGLQRIALKRDGGLVLNAHPSKAGLTNGDGSSGSTAWNNSVRSRLYLARKKLESDQGRPTGPLGLEIMKANYAPIGDRIDLEWQDGFFVAKNLSAGENHAYRKISAETAFLDCLSVATGRRTRVSESKFGTYAPKYFSNMPEAKGHDVRSLEGAMRRLMHAGRIINGPCVFDKNGRDGILLVPHQPSMGAFKEID